MTLRKIRRQTRVKINFAKKNDRRFAQLTTRLCVGGLAVSGRPAGRHAAVTLPCHAPMDGWSRVNGGS